MLLENSLLSAYITHRDCLLHEMGPGHPECPQRIDSISDFLLAKGLLDLMLSYDAPQATREQLQRVHAAQYVAEIEAASPASGYFHLDPDTTMNPHTLTAAKRAAGAAVLATDLVIAGAVKNAFCSVRPPGHHAERARGMGFCFFNNVAVGIAHALERHKLKKVALVDFDVHHGNGSEDIFKDDPRVLMVSTFEQHIFPYTGDAPQGPNMVSVPLAARSRGDAMREAVLHAWLPAIERHQPEMIFVSAGFDAHREDEMANLGWIDADYAWITRHIVHMAARYGHGRIVSVLEGGYALDALARSVAAHVGVLIGAYD
jgi:acetoin utilization deacetylase AcuC-like enzyme